MDERNLIDALSRDLQPADTRWPLARIATVWLIASAAYVFIATALLGPFRPEAFQDLLQAPRFALEMMLGTAAFVGFAVIVFAEAIPGVELRRIRIAVWLCLGLWLLQFGAGFWWPVLEPSMLGKRAHCMLEAFVLSVPPVIVALWLQYRRYALRPVRAGIYAAIAAGLPPAIVMQVACMYAPAHILQFHVLPVLVLIAVVACVVLGFQVGSRVKGIDEGR